MLKYNNSMNKHDIRIILLIIKSTVIIMFQTMLKYNNSINKHDIRIILVVIKSTVIVMK